MKNKYLYLVLPSICISLSSCNLFKKESTVEKPESHIWSAYSTENLLSDRDYFDGEERNEMYAKRDKTLRFSCLKNENEGAQLMITAADYINSFDFELPDVTGTSGTISKDCFSVSAAYYLNIDYSNEKTAASGYYPDALIPLANYKFRRMNYIDKGRTQALYINLKTEKNTPAGEFKGTGKLTLDGKSYDIPFEVKVYNAELPDAVHQNSAFGIWYDQITYGERENTGSEMEQTYYDFIVSKRISPREIPTAYTSSIDKFIEYYVDKVAFNDKIASIRLPITQTINFVSDVNTILDKLIKKNLELIAQRSDPNINLFKKVFFYIDDEPYPDTYDLVRYHDKTIYDAKQTLKSQLDSYPSIKESFIRIPNVVTREFTNELVATETKGGIQTWCPLISYFQSVESRELYNTRQASTSDRSCGEHVWWYTCCDPQSPYPNYHLDSSLMLARVYNYMEYSYGIEANLFWSVNYYSKYSRGETLRRDIWNDPISWQLCAGDGQFVYPGYTFGIYGPITTLRLENTLAGNEEYEYLWMINQKVEEYNSLNGTSLVTNNLLQKYYSRLFENVIIKTDNENFEVVRAELLSLIEKLYSNLNDGMSILTK